MNSSNLLLSDFMISFYYYYTYLTMVFSWLITPLIVYVVLTQSKSMKQFKWLQVSTWFANARRRLKKENGGNCSIKRREEGEDDDDDMAELDRPSSSASNISCGSNIKEGECGVI